MKQPIAQLTILVAEHNSRMREFLRRGLELEGYNVYSMMGGLYAVEVAGDLASLDLVILGTAAPGCTATEMCQRFREIRTVPILALGVGGPIERSELLGAGADDYIPKPFAFGELMFVIRRLLAGNPRPK